MIPGGFRLHPAALDADAQARLVDLVFELARRAPFQRFLTPSGAAMSVEMTNFGSLGWTSGRDGYAYRPDHPGTGLPWPPMPECLNALWARYTDEDRPPDACLVNLYRGRARMGLHRDGDEVDLTAPVVSVSLGDTAVFRIGGGARRDPTRSIRLTSGDVCVMAGEARRMFHGIDRVVAGSSSLIPDGGRLNLTLRRAG